MGKGHKIHLWAHIRMFPDNAFMQLKVTLKREKWKGEEEWDPGQKVMLGVTGPQSLEKSDDPDPPRPGSDCGPRYPWPLGSLVKTSLQALQQMTSFQEALDWECPPHHQEGRIIITSVSNGSFQNTHPHIFPYFLKHSSSNSQTPYKEKQYYIINILYWTPFLIYKTTIFHWQLEGSPYSQMS